MAVFVLYQLGGQAMEMQMRAIPLSPFEEELWKEVAKLPVKRVVNGHSHVDRGNTLYSKYLEHIHVNPADISKISLPSKQKMVGKLHEGEAYAEADLISRMSDVFERQILYGTTEIWTCIDVSPDLKTDGLMAFNVACNLRDEFAGRLKILVGPNAIFGFKEGTDRWPAYKRAAQTADFLSALPEKDFYPDMVRLPMEKSALTSILGECWSWPLK